MKSTAIPLAVTGLIAAATLSACAGEEEAQGDMPSPEGGVTSTEVDSPNSLPTAEPTESDLSEITDPVKAKEVALAEGRPEAAWDKYCVAWDIENPEQGGTGLANETATSWLESYDADCPDAIVYPGYYAESFANGEPGEVIVTLKRQAITEYFIDPDSEKGFQEFGFHVLDGALEDNPELEAVTVTAVDSDRSWTATPDQLEEGILTAP